METRTLTDSTFEFGTTPFYFLRHGETHESREGIVQGQNETELTTAGRRMAEAAAETLLNASLGSIYASPLKRAWTTASIVSVLTGVPVYALPDGTPLGQVPRPPQGSSPDHAQPGDGGDRRGPQTPRYQGDGVDPGTVTGVGGGAFRCLSGHLRLRWNLDRRPDLGGERSGVEVGTADGI
jgi:hypothetical protein